MVRSLVFLLAALVLPASLTAQDAIRSAMSAGPTSISAEATIMDWSFDVLREGSNGWTCLPDNQDSPGNDPWCITDAWMNFLNAYVGQTEPTYEDIGFAYMLRGDTPVSNSDPYATEATGPEDWVTELHAHLMMLVPDLDMLEGISTDHHPESP